MIFASSDLREEHEGILHGLHILENMAGREDLALADANDIAAFLVLFADKCHHGKEEGLMFPAMEKSGVPKEGGPIGRMLAEHGEGRRLMAAMREASGGDHLDLPAFRQAAEAYVGLMRAHIDKENNVLFPMGDRLLPEAEQRRLLAAFQQHEDDVMGPGVHEHLHEVLARLAGQYGG
ncbi:MAG: hemerythrin domain-containing protein [Christensenellales bacterium]